MSERLIINTKYFEWTTIQCLGSRYGRKSMYYWKCKCCCGNIREVREQYIINGESRSCGCKNAEYQRALTITHGDSTSKGTHHYLYTTWSSIKNRTTNPNEPSWKDYGERGINMFNEWRVYENFKKWILENIGERPEKYTLDRINNNGNYEPGNVRWATWETQANNRRETIKKTNDKIQIKFKKKAFNIKIKLPKRKALSCAQYVHKYRFWGGKEVDTSNMIEGSPI